MQWKLREASIKKSEAQRGPHRTVSACQRYGSTTPGPAPPSAPGIWLSQVPDDCPFRNFHFTLSVAQPSPGIWNWSFLPAMATVMVLAIFV